MTESEIWVLTRTIEYECTNQFCRAWIGKPTADQIEPYADLDALGRELLLMNGEVYLPSEDATYTLFQQDS